MKYTLKIYDHKTGDESVRNYTSFAKAIKDLKDELARYVDTGCTHHVTLSIWDSERQDFVRYICYMNN